MGGDNLFIRGFKMEKGNITLRMVAAVLLSCLVLIPISSSVSMTQDRLPSPKAPVSGGWGQEKINERAIIEISAAVVASGVFLPVTADDYKDSTSQR
jgi:hypothetical protein